MKMAISDNWKKIMIGAIIVFSILLVLIGLMLGLSGLKDFFKFLVIGLLILSLFAGAVYVVILLFFTREYKDIPAQFKKKLISVMKVMENDMLGDLYLSGDTKHNRIKLGKYFYLRINLPKIITDKDKDNVHPESKTEPVPIDCFIVKRKGFLDKLFSDYFVILVKPEDHDYSAIFNDVTIKAFNLVPVDNQFYTIDRRNLDIDLFKGLALNYNREVVYDIFRDLDRLVKQAMSLDHRFQKEKERSREFEIPQLSNFLQQGGK